MIEWQTLPTELWYLVLGDIPCMFDRAQLSATCNVLRNIVSGLPPSPPLLAFRCCANKITDLSDNNEEVKLSFQGLLSLKSLVTKDLGEEEVYEPHFVDLVIRWLKAVKPLSDSAKELIWRNIAFSESSKQQLCRRLAVEFSELLDCRSVSSKPLDLPIYKYERHDLYVDKPLFERVKEIGHVVLGLPTCKEDFIRCTEGQSCQRPFTLTIESGYYVIRNSTFEEFHQQCIRDCKSDENEEGCCFKLYQDDPVVFSWMFLAVDTEDISNRRYVSLFLNNNEVIDKMVDEVTEYYNFDLEHLEQYYKRSPFINIISVIVKEKGYSILY